MMKHPHQWYCLSCLALFSHCALAEGMLDLKPYVNVGLSYDDNLFRFSSDAVAKAAGFNQQSDLVKTLGAGLTANLRLSRQLITASVDLNQNQFDTFSSLNNTGKSLSLGWNWRIGSDVYGEISTSENESISSFNDNQIRVKNVRKASRQRANINWDFLSSWTVYATKEMGELENEQIVYKTLDREDDSYEAGISYINPLGTQISFFYRNTDFNNPNKNVFTATLFGSKFTQKQLGLNLAWLPTSKTRVSGNISKTDFNRIDGIQKDFSGLNQRWSIAHALTGKTNFNLSAYKEATSVDDFSASYVEFKGMNGSLTWNLTNKVSLSGGLGYEEREYLGGSSFSVAPSQNNDESKRANATLSYLPTDKTLLRLAYQHEKREANIVANGYQYNTINFIAQYSF